MKHLLVLTAIVSTISSLPLIEDYYGPYWSSNRFKGVLQQAFNSSGSIHQRFIRANVDNLKAPLERLQRIARITNGIYLLKELFAGKIPADELISELLFFGPVAPSEITKLDEQAILPAIETLKNLPDNLEAKDKILKVEGVFNGLHEILKKVDGMGNLQEWDEGKKRFKAEIGKLADNGIETSLLDTLHDVGTWKSRYTKIKNNGATADSGTFSEAEKALEALKKAIEDVDDSGLNWNFDGFETVFDGISPIMKAANGSSVYSKIDKSLAMDKTLSDAYSTFLETTEKEIDAFKTINPSLDVIKTLIFNIEQESRDRNLQHTHGLPEGFSDVKDMLIDVGDAWVKKIVTTDALKTAFKQFDVLTPHLSKLESVLDFKGQGISAVNGILERSSSISSVFANANIVKANLNQGYECQRVLGDPIDDTEFQKIKEPLASLNERLRLLKIHTASLSEALKKDGLSKMCDEVIQICKEAQNAGNIQDLVTKFQTYEKLEELNGVFAKIDEIDTSIKSFKPGNIKTDADNARTNFDALDSYHTALNHYAAYFDCLQKQKELNLIFGMIEEIKKIRNFKLDSTYKSSLDNGRKVVRKVTGVKADIEKLKSTIDDMNKFKSPETDEFNVFEKTGDISKVIGGAVQGVANMKNAIDKKTETVDKVLNNMQFVENNQKLLTDPTDAQNLQDLIGLKPSIQSMYSTLDTFIGSVKDNDSPVLKNHSDLFKSAKSVSGVTGDFFAMILSLENLKTKIPGSKNLEELQTSLKTMETMGLDFAKYKGSFDNSGSSLGDLDVAFANYNKRMARKTSSSTRQQGAASGSQGSGNNKSEKKDGSTNMVVYIAGSAAGAVLGAFAVSGFFFVWRPWKKRRNMRKFLDNLMEDLHLRYLNIKKEEEKGENSIDILFERASKNDYLAMKDFLVTKTDPCKKEECEVEHELVKSSAMVLKGYGDLFESDHYHAEVVPISKKKKVIISHYPTKLPGKTPETVAKFFWMAKQYRSETIVSLDISVKREKVDPKNKSVNLEYIPEKEGESLNFDNVTIKCLEMETISDKKKYPKLQKAIEKRKLEIKIKNQKPFTVNYIWTAGWADSATEATMKMSDLGYILNMIENDKTPPIIVSREVMKAEVLALVLFARHLVRNNSGITYTTILQRFSEHTDSTLSSALLYKVSIFFLYDFLTQDGKVKVKDETKKRYEILKNPEVEKKTAEGGVATKTEVLAKTGDPSKSEVPSKN